MAVTRNSIFLKKLQKNNGSVSLTFISGLNKAEKKLFKEKTRY